MPIAVRCLVLAAGLSLAPPAPAAAAANPERLRTEIIPLRVTLDAQGKVQSSKSSDAKAAPGIISAAERFARKLTFSPARKNGVAVPGETTLAVVLAIERRADGNFGLRLQRATNGPGVLKLGSLKPPKNLNGGENGALVVVGVSLLADGRPDMSTLTTERMELRVPSSFAEARYLDTIKNSLRGSRFELDQVDGVAVPERVNLPYLFGGGAAKVGPVDENGQDGRMPAEIELPSLNPVSAVPGLEVARIDYRASEPAGAPSQ